MVTAAAGAVASAREVAAGTPDPELPGLTIDDLGILRAVETDEHGGVVVTITPTYSGCPAMREITADIERRLRTAGHDRVEIRVRLAPAWTSDWITPGGRGKLRAAGIAPPAPARERRGPVPLTLGRRPAAPCPACGGDDTAETARFGATACRSLHRCRTCGEPFEAVKSI